MRTISNFIAEKLNEMQTALPGILAEKSIDDFDKYAIGYPTDQDKKFCCVLFSEGSRTPSKETTGYTVHLQLPGVSETDAYKYIDAVKQHLISGDNCENITIAMSDNFRVSTIGVFFEVTESEELDDCDL